MSVVTWVLRGERAYTLSVMRTFSLITRRSMLQLKQQRREAGNKILVYRESLGKHFSNNR